MYEDRVPDETTIFYWIERIYEQGVRRPGYPADLWAEQYIVERFRDLGLEKVRREPAPLAYWEPRRWSLRVESDTGEAEVPCFPLPHAAPTAGTEGELAAFDAASPAAVKGKLALFEVPLLRLPPAFPTQGAGSVPGLDDALAVRLSPGGRSYDPEGSFAGSQQVLPFGAPIQTVMEPSIEAGASAFIGILSGYPGDSCRYYVPYDAVPRRIPGVWIRGSDGLRLRRRLEAGPVRARLQVEAVREPITSWNIVGELPGADEECVLIGSHHDGPWASAVEDGSGVALVLAQAAYWSSVPRQDRPHRLVFLLNAGHMAGSAGCRAFVEQHADELPRIVLEVHLEHAAREFVERDGGVVASGLPEPRWWFTSRIPRLEGAVWDAIVGEDLRRSLLIPPDAIGPQPTTDGGLFHTLGVPLVNFLSAPFYLFDEIDRLDKIDREGLVPVSRAAIRIVESTRGVSAAAMRAGAPV